MSTYILFSIFITDKNKNYRFKVTGLYFINNKITFSTKQIN